MHSRVQSLEMRERESIERAQETNELPALVLPDMDPNSYLGREEMLDAVEAIYKPILTAMKLCGAYFGEASFKNLGSAAFYGKNGLVYVSFIYCCAITVFFWLFFFMVLVSLFMEGTSVLGTFYSLIALCMWSFAIALVSTTCLVVLPLIKWKQSRFEKFLQNVVERKVQLRKLQYHYKKGLILAVFLFIISAVTVIVGFLKLPNFTVARYKPWNGLHMNVLVIFSLIYQIYSLSIWLLPILFFCMTCLVLERLFDCFCARVSSLNSNCSLDVIAIKEEHQKLCETVRLAGDIFSPLLLEIVAVYIPLLCFNFYAAVNPPPSDNEGSSILLSAIGGLYWLVGSSSILAVITVFGSRVNEKIYKVQDILQTFKVPDGDEGKLLLFLFYLNGEQKGLSVGGLVVITKSLSLTILGVLVSYFSIILTLPK